MVIQHNIPALNSHRNLGINNAKTAKNLEKLSSGFRINRAGDDAAGLAISEKMRGQISGLAMAEQNANNGISLIQTAEGGLNETHAILQRMRELAVQSSNGTYQDEDRSQIELEYQALKQEIDRIASSTHYNGIKLLDGTVGGVMLSNVSAAERLSGTNTEVMKMMGITAGTAPTLPVLPGTGQITSSTKGIYQEMPMDDNATAIAGFDTKMADIAAATSGTGDTFKGINFMADIVLTKTDGGWEIDVSGMDVETKELLKDMKVSFDAAAGKISIKAANGDALEIDFANGYTEADVLPTGVTYANGLGGYASGSTISLKAHIFTAANGDVTDSGYSAVVKGETVDPLKAAVTANSALGDLTYSWNAKSQMWDVTGELLMSDATTGISETVSVAFSFDPTKTGTQNFDVLLKDGSTFALTVNQSQFTAPKTELADGSSFTVHLDAATRTLIDVEGYKYAAPKAPTPDSERANRMLSAMGISNTAKFNVNTALMNGSTSDKILFESLNDKDAYIITRQSTADADRGKFNAPTQYETVLQVNGTTYLGTFSGSNLEFKDAKGTVVATLTGAKQATETGSIRFGTGDRDSAYYNQFLVEKEGAQIGSENVSNLVFQVGANGTEDQRIGMYVFNMSSDNIGNHAKGNFVSASTIVTRDEANIAVDTLDNAINYVSAQRANLGALQNRLEHTLNNLGVTKENLTAAESSIRDVDMAKEMMDFTKNNILVQAAQAMLAQANSLPQGVLSLLR